MSTRKRYLSETIHFFNKHAWRRWYLLLPSIILITSTKIVEVQATVAYKNLINLLLPGVAEKEALYGVVFVILGLNILNWFSWRIVELLLNFWQPDVLREMGEDSYLYLLKHSNNFFNNNFVGSLVKKLNRLPHSFETVSDILLFNMYPTLILIVFSIITIYQISPILSSVLGIFLMLFIGANTLFAIYKMQFDNLVNAADTKWGGFVADTITNSSNIQLFGSLDREMKSFKKITHYWRRINTKNWNVSSIGNSVQAAMMITVEIAFVFIGIEQWFQGKITTGDFVLFQGLLIAIFGNIWDFGRNLRNMGKGFADAQEMIEIMNTPHEIQNIKGANDLQVNQGDILIQDLQFGYSNERQVFRGFTLHIPAGKKIALVSRSGEGKSTLTKLLMRFYNVPEGSIFIDSKDIMKVTLNSLRRSISFVPQEPILFHRTLQDNICYGKPDVTMDEIIEASKKAHCHEFITRLSEGYQTFVGERGVKLSGGERQRVAIARAILEDCPILILDEATSSLDSESEHLIQEALKELMKEKTTIVIAHRLSTINQMDEIIILEHGDITERGTHEELLKKENGHYRMLWEIQSGGYEV